MNNISTAMDGRDELLLEMILTTLRLYEGCSVLVKWPGKCRMDQVVYIAPGDPQGLFTTIVEHRPMGQEVVYHLNPKGALFYFKGAMVREIGNLPQPPFSPDLPPKRVSPRGEPERTSDHASAQA